MSSVIPTGVSRLFGVAFVYVSSVGDWRSFGATALADFITTALRNGLVGVDAEWVGKRPTAVLQLATQAECVVLHLSEIVDKEPRLAEMLRCLLEDSRIVKCGVNINGDSQRMKRELGISMAPLFEVDHFAVAFADALFPPLPTAASPDSKRKGFASLAALSAALLKVELGKDMSITLSDWEKSPLTLLQLQYAVDDAVASYRVGRVIYTQAAASLGVSDVTIQDFVSHNAPCAKTAFKKWHRDLSRQQQAELDNCAQRHRDSLSGAAPVEDPFNVQSLISRLSLGDAVVAPSSYHSVSVLDQRGELIFHCDARKAEWYLKRGLAVAGRWHGEPHASKLESIHLTFEPKKKTKLCMNFQLGTCQIGGSCPYAHGSDELLVDTEANHLSNDASSAESRNRRNDTQCAICLSTSVQHLRHAVVPPCLRRHLPPPFHCAVSDDFLLVCIQCNPRVRIAYDQFLKLHFNEANELALRRHVRPVNISLVKRVIGFAQLLSAPRPEAIHAVECSQSIPEARIAEMRTYVKENWREVLDAGDADVLPQADAEAHLSEELLCCISKLVPGDVRARAAVAQLVEGDANKAIGLISRWREFFAATFKPQYIPWLQDL